MNDNGKTWATEVHWWRQARKVFHFLLAITGWGSLLILLWAVLLGWLPQSGWIVKVMAGVVFALAGLIGVSAK